MFFLHFSPRLKTDLPVIDTGCCEESSSSILTEGDRLSDLASFLSLTLVRRVFTKKIKIKKENSNDVCQVSQRNFCNADAEEMRCGARDCEALLMPF